MLRFNLQKTKLQREFNEKLKELREEWPGLTVDVQAKPLRNNVKRESNIVIIGKPGKYIW